VDGRVVIRVDRVDAVEIGIDPAPPAFSAAETARIARHWRVVKRRHPEVFDGDILLVRDVAVAAGRLTATAVRTRYSVLMALIEGRLQGPALGNAFGGAAILSADGAVFLGRMAAHCYEPGVLKLVSGTPDLDDIDHAANRLDIAGSIAREVAEETGLDVAEAVAAPRLTVVRDGPLVVVVQPLRFALPAAALQRRIDQYLKSLERSELAEVVAVAGPDDPALAEVPGYVRAAVADVLAEGAERRNG
jgi:8-oxo-dGTP pyrophosphatase MutT (NUDIX family)